MHITSQCNTVSLYAPFARIDLISIRQRNPLVYLLKIECNMIAINWVTKQNKIIKKIAKESKIEHENKTKKNGKILGQWLFDYTMAMQLYF